ncbi:MAG: AMP-binding protein [Clostridia bacterium]|nr:AMP-binding protein [Clostridia bacterium]
MQQKETFFDYPDFNNIKEIMQYSLEKHPKNIAFRLKEKEGKKVKYIDITYEKFFKEVNEFGAGLYEIGMQNKRIAIISKNRYEWVLSYISILFGGMVAVPLDKDLTESEIENSLIKSKAECIIYDKKYEEVITKIQEKTNIKTKICMDKWEEQQNVQEKSETNKVNNNIVQSTIKEVQEKGKEALSEGKTDFINATIKEKELAVLVFTSGTTSNSKAVMLSQYNIAKNICDMQKVEPFQSTDVNLALLPYHHTFGSTGQLIMLCNGITTVYCDGLRYIGQNLKEYGVTFFVGVPKLIEAMYEKLQEEIKKQKKEKIIKIAKIFTNLLLKLGIDIRRKTYKKIIDQLGGLRFVINGAAALNKDVEKGFNDLGVFIVQGYGLTECSPVLSAENYKYRRYGSIGMPMPSVDLEIANKNEDGIGEIRVKCPNLMLGYLDNQEATDEVIRDGWFYTGDLGYIDKDGFVFISGRKKDMIVLKNGKKIFPEEMEDLINRIDLVEESFVFGLPKGDGDYLLSVKIKYDENKVKTEYPNGISQEELKNVLWNKVKEVNKNVPKYKHIKNIMITTEEFIKTSTNKIKRFEEIKRVVQN